MICSHTYSRDKLGHSFVCLAGKALVSVLPGLSPSLKGLHLREMEQMGSKESQ